MTITLTSHFCFFPTPEPQVVEYEKHMLHLSCCRESGRERLEADKETITEVTLCTICTMMPVQEIRTKTFHYLIWFSIFPPAVELHLSIKLYNFEKLILKFKQCISWCFQNWNRKNTLLIYVTINAFLILKKSQIVPYFYLNLTLSNF